MKDRFDYVLIETSCGDVLMTNFNYVFNQKLKINTKAFI